MIEYQKSEKEVIKFNEKRFFLADSTVFDIFTFPFIKGNPKTALDAPNKLVITESMVKKYFGDEDPIGKTLKLEEGLDFEVTGVIKDVPAQSHFQFDFLGSLSTFRQIRGGQLPQSWVWNPCWTFVLLHEGVSPEQVNKQLPDFYLRHYDDFKDEDITLYLQPLVDIHLKSHLEYEVKPNSFISYIYILSAIAAFILIIACINFMNLTTANSAGRAKEIGVKKVFGAQRSLLIKQFMGESTILSFIALIIAVILIELLLPWFNNFTDKSFTTDFILEPKILGGLVLMGFVIGIFAGTYPAIFLSSFQPIKVLKGTLKSGAKSSLARKILVITQFTISTALIIGTVLVFQQLKYLRNADIGFNKEQVIIIPTVRQIVMEYDTFLAELKKNPDVLYISGSDDVLGMNHNTYAFQIEGLDPEKTFFCPALMVRHDFLETYGIEVIEGRGFSKEILTDTAEAIIINEAMAKSLGWTNKEAIGKRFINDGNERVIGVIKDFNAISLHKKAETFVLDMLRRPGSAAFRTQFIAIRFNTNNYSTLIEYIGEKWKQFAPTRPFEYSFLNKDLDELYNNEEQFSQLAFILTILTIFIASLGLIGLTAYLAEQRTLEIGIRRVMGSSVGNIIQILSKEFIVLITIANIISWPVAYFLIQGWLQNFSKQAPINWFVFILAFAITVLLTILIAGHRAYQATSANPVDTLKHE
jgi:putative ABC transport system permease protein